MPYREENFWLGTATMPTGDPASALPDAVDVAIIGAGFTGLSAARTLRVVVRRLPCSRRTQLAGAQARGMAAWF